MSDTTETGVLLLDPVTGAQIGLIKFDPSGMLVYQVIKKGLPVSAFKPVDRLLNGQWIKKPLYKKHATSLGEDKKLPREILEQEANSCADFLNALENPLIMAGTVVKALKVSMPSAGK